MTQPLTPPNLSTPVNKVHQVELLISNLLRIGVFTSLAVVVLGTILTFVHHPDYVSSHDDLSRLTNEKATFPHTLNEMADGLRRTEGRSVVLLGLLLLVATPVLRVAVSIFAFVYERDPAFVVITSIVLVLLLLSFALGKAQG